MRRFTTLVVLFAVFLYPAVTRAGYWQQVSGDQVPQALQLMHPRHFLVYTMDEAALKLQLFSLSADPSQGATISLPLPDGSFRDFKVWQTPLMPEQLAAKYPDIRTFTAEAVDDHRATAKLDFTIYGFSAMIYDGANTSFIDPFDNFHDGYYLVHYRRDETRAASQTMKCGVHTTDENGPAGQRMDITGKGLPKLAYKTVNGTQLRTFRLALACDHQYADSATESTAPTVTETFSKMATTMNRVNGVYEREIAVTLTFVNNEDALIFVNPATDPYGPDDADPVALLDDNQRICDSIIGNANYDIGHVFTTAGGGLSQVGVVCLAGEKAQSETGLSHPVGDGFDINYVAHEMGHEHGGNHPFNSSADECSGNINEPTAYEPGSGSTIMAYAGICYPDDIQKNSDAYFHSVNLLEIQNYITTGIGNTCGTNTATGNKLVSYSPFGASYTIPYKTPFELTAPTLTDSVADSITLYCWEEWDLGDYGLTLAQTHFGPIFRSYYSITYPTRVFPNPELVRDGILYFDYMDDNEGEKVPDTARTMHFHCTFRDIFNGTGCFTVPDDEDTLAVVATPTYAGFAVTSQGSTGISYSGQSAQIVTWNVVGTNSAPVSTDHVDIYMSVDGGLTWPYPVGTFPNTGSAVITVPNPAVSTTTARFKVKGHGNVFFNVNSFDFSVSYNSSYPVGPNTAGVKNTQPLANGINVFPVPATSMLYITSASVLQAVIYNTLGQQVWKGAVDGSVAIPVSSWAKGMYYMHSVDAGNQSATKKFIVQ